MKPATLARWAVAAAFSFAAAYADTPSPTTAPAPETAVAAPSTPIPVTTEPQAAPPSDEAFQSLLSSLDKSTDLATKSKLNTDYVPGFITVLDGEEAFDRGARTIGEAFDLIPGTQLGYQQLGNPYPIIRGIDRDILFLINGAHATLPQSIAPFGLAQIPIEAVERIEVIRGPASALYGEHALGGVINVVLKENAKNVYGRYDVETRRYTGGANFSSRPPESNFSVSGNTWFSRQGGPSMSVGPDLGGRFIPPNEREMSFGGNINTQYRDTHFDVIYFKQRQGDYFGNLNYMSGSTAYTESSDYVLTRVSQDIHLKHVESTAYYSFSYNKQENDAYVPPFVPFFGPPTPPFPAKPPYPPISAFYQTQHEHRVGLDNRFTLLDDHHLLVGGEISHVRIPDSYNTTNYNNTLSKTASDGQQRTVYSAYAQDEWHVTERFHIVPGVRMDDYTGIYKNIRTIVTPKAAAIYRVTDEHTVKAQYAEAFTPAGPNFAASVPTLPAEKNRTYEIGHIYNNQTDTTVRTSLFLTEYNGFATFRVGGNGALIYNANVIHADGAEVEATHRIVSNLTATGNINYVGFSDTIVQGFGDGARFTARAALEFEFHPGYFATVQYRKEGDRFRLPGDTRGHLTGWDAIDFFLAVKNVLNSGFDLRAGVKNMFDDRIAYPSELGAPFRAFANDYQFVGREFFIAASYSWK